MLKITTNPPPSNETVRMLLEAHSKVVLAYQEIEILFGPEMAKNLDTFTRKIILETEAGSYARIMTRLKGLLLLGVSSVSSAKAICDQYGVGYDDFIVWVDLVPATFNGVEFFIEEGK